jgi:hypothetical protein
LGEGLEIFPAEVTAPLEREVLVIFENVDRSDRIAQAKCGSYLVHNTENGGAGRHLRHTLEGDLEVGLTPIDVTDREFTDRVGSGVVREGRLISIEGSPVGRRARGSRSWSRGGR